MTCDCEHQGGTLVPCAMHLEWIRKEHGPGKFCETMRVWARACMAELATDDPEKKAWRNRFREHWVFVERAITKSCLLDRLLYDGEKLRTKPCPVHMGKWTGCLPPSEITCGCGHNNCVTGWLP